MNLLTRAVLIICVIGICVSGNMAQNYPSFNKYWEPINNAFNSENFFEAHELITKALEYQQMTDTLHYLGGVAAYKLNAYGRSEAHFRRLAGTSFESRHPDIDYYLAEILFTTGRYSEASNLYKSYMPSVDPDSREGRFVTNRIYQASWAKENQNNRDPLVKIKRIENGVNTPENESGPYMSGKTLYYSGYRKKSEKVLDSKSFAIQFFAVNEADGKSVVLDSGLTEAGVKMGNPNFSPDHQRFIYTVVTNIEGTTRLNSQLYIKILRNGIWSKGRRLPEQVNLSNYNSTHGCIIPESEEGLYRIYFSSDRPNGKGGFDIWTVLLNEDGSCTLPENIESINTEGDEYSPYYSGRTKTLFFSSNYHPGFGGQDVFKYSYKGKDSLKLINLGKSVNSSYDEITYHTVNEENVAFVASNRPGSNYLDENIQACCYDIYKINSTPRTIDLLVTVRDGFDSLDINGARVELFDITDGDTIVASSEPLDKASHLFKLTEGHKYRILASKNSYLGDSAKVSAIDLYNYDPIKKTLYLTQKKTLDVLTFERTTNFNLKGVMVKLWDLDHNRLIEEITKVDTNLFNFSIYKGTNYLLIASKPKYESDTVRITAMQTSLENPLQRKMYLELSAIAELRRLLPIRLFFDNDLPNPRSDADTTDVLFSKIYNEYSNRKAVYMYQYADVLKGPARAKAMLEIDTFFDKEVKYNGDKFLIFLDKLSIIMEEGHSIDIFLKGYASPRAKSEYNQHLSARRVTCISNEFDYYQNGIFHPFIRDNALKIKEIPFGESQSSTDVSDSLEDSRNSIYNLKAAFERRVEILEILKGVDDVQHNNQ